MERGKFYRNVADARLLEILSHLMPDRVDGLCQVCERYGDGEADVRCYDVYLIKAACGGRVLKKTDRREALLYERYLSGNGFAVPRYYGKWEAENSVWILIEQVGERDLRDMTDELAVSAADSLAQIQNHFWRQEAGPQGARESDGRFAEYWKRILRRAAAVAEQPALRKAYQLFLNRQLTCPRTLSHGDLLAWNALQAGQRVLLIDWGFGGIMPYSLDIARFIAHATEERSTFPFYMNEKQKQLFVNRVYDQLRQKPARAQYLWDIKLAVLNEYIEFVEADEDEDKWYYHHAVQLANEILLG